MSYANDKLYSGYLRKNMPRIVTTVKPREIVVHLPCLTDHDRETIEAKRETCGSFDAMVRLLDCLKRRENWPEQFIAALEACEHQAIAAEIRAEYDALRGINNSSPPPAPPAANVVMAHVHPAPSAPHLPPPGPTASVPPPQDVLSEASETQPIQETEKPAPQSSPALVVAPVMEVIPPEPPQHQIEAVVVPPVTPPPSPDSMRGSARGSPSSEQFISHQEPVEDLEPESLPAQAVPNETINNQQEAEENIELPQAPEIQVEPCEVDDLTQTATMVEQDISVPIIVNENAAIINSVNEPIVTEPEPVTAVVEDTTTTNTVEEAALTTTTIDTPIVLPAAVEASPGRSESPLTNLDDLILTPEKPPVQETKPTVEKVPSVVPVMEKTSEPQNTQVFKIPQEIEVTPGPPAEAVVTSGVAVSEDDDICFSKPGILVSVEPPDQNNTTFRPPTPEYSGDSARLEMSEDVPSCQENCINHNKPDKEVSESTAPSLEEDSVRETVGHVAEDPSVLNKEVHSQLMEESNDLTKEISIAPPIAASTLISDHSVSTDPGESAAPNLNDNEDPAIEKTVPVTTMTSETTSCPNGEEISESPAPSLDMEDVRENTVHVAEDPSVLNLVEAPLHQNGDSESEEIKEFKAITKVEQEANETNAQTHLIQGNGEPAKEIAPTLPNSGPSTNDNHKPNDPPTDLKLPDSAKTNRSLNTRYIMTAAGVGACALLIAWRFKN
ncbi:hypothetical protein NL108_009446 [Boleophthalmus pectinirostris]|nr:mitochondrial antiviral-signaling protein isoform X2 [Boleophthalmus pectinirostris]KAJ0062948.1 hypothetical protein NL108_009446 [Boleophthalmus pectinirostris]